MDVGDDPSENLPPAAGWFREHVYAGEDLAFSAVALELGFRVKDLSQLVGQAWE